MVNVLQDELLELGCVAVQGSGKSAVAFGVPDLKTVLQVLLWCRTAHKIMEALVETQEPLFTRDDLYQFVQDNIPVDDLLLADAKGKDWLTLSVHVTLNNPKYIPADINHSHYTALQIKNALVDAARDRDSRPTVDTTDHVDVPLTAVLRGIPGDPMPHSQFPSAGAHLSLYRGIHTGSLHRRGYRYGTAVHKAALKESTAAGLLYAAGWPATTITQKQVLVDPMMGSGTLVLEAAMMAADLAPGLMRLKCGVPASLDPPILRRNSLIVNADG